MSYLANGAYPNIWIGLPKTGPEPHSGMSRPAIYEVIRAGKVKSACIRKPGNLTGKRLVWLPSLLAYIEGHVQTPQAYSQQSQKVKEARRHVH